MIVDRQQKKTQSSVGGGSLLNAKILTNRMLLIRRPIGNVRILISNNYTLYNDNDMFLPNGPGEKKNIN